jgi:oxygen-independent coproporphyrinogen-3 oxidase
MSDAPAQGGHAVPDQPGGLVAAPRATVCAEPLEGNYFVSTYPPFSTWSTGHLPAVDRALNAAPRPDVPLGLYVHIPFCVKRCQYCYYLACDDQPAPVIDAYLEAVLRELARYRDAAALRGRRPLFVYIGGGTPSLLTPHRIERLLSGLAACLPWSDVREVTFECAPQSVTMDKLHVLHEAGVTRISMGVQQLDDEVLLAAGRVHTVQDVRRAYRAIRSVDFPVVNLDLMAGLVGESDESFGDSLDRVIAMQPESVTIYPLEIPLNTPLYRSMRDGLLCEPICDWPTKRARVGRAFARLERAGYSVRSAYAAVRDPLRHAFVYQDEQYRGADLLGVGVASFSYLSGVHFQNLTALEPYLNAVEPGRRTIGRAYALSDEERLIREFVLQLKLGGVDGDQFRRKFGVDPATRFAAALEPHCSAGLLNFGRAGVRLTRAGLLCIDRLLSDFYRPEHREVRYS